MHIQEGKKGENHTRTKEIRILGEKENEAVTLKIQTVLPERRKAELEENGEGGLEEKYLKLSNKRYQHTRYRHCRKN
jgi:hypothetical protein